MLAWPRTPWRLRPKSRRWDGMLARLAEMAPEIDPDRKVRDLAGGERQLVELVKALNLEARLVILDEPTSVLTPAETRRLWERVRLLAGSGRAVVFITHKFEDVEACADRVAVMRQGRMIANVSASEASVNDLVALMMGQGGFREAGAVPPPRAGAPRVWVKRLSARSGSAHIRDVEFQMVPGEILGVAGVAGNGQYLLAEALAGRHAPESGEILLDGESLSREDGFEPDDARVAYIPEQPAINGIAADLDVSVNLALKRLRALPFFPDWKAVREDAMDLIRRFDVRPPDPSRPAGDLSGGNIQKLVIARELSGKPALIVACYPTMGLDLNAAKAVYENLFRHAAEGACVIWISEDLDDLLAYAHRIAVLCRGRIAGILPASAADRERVGLLMAGHGGEGDHALARARSAAEPAGAPR